MGNASKMDRPAKEPEDPVLVGGFRFGGGHVAFSSLMLAGLRGIQKRQRYWPYYQGCRLA